MKNIFKKIKNFIFYFLFKTNAFLHENFPFIHQFIMNMLHKTGIFQYLRNAYWKEKSKAEHFEVLHHYSYNPQTASDTERYFHQRLNMLQKRQQQ